MRPMQLGLLAGSAPDLKLKLTVRDADAYVEKSCTSLDREEVRTARSAAKNTFEFVSWMLADRGR